MARRTSTTWGSTVWSSATRGLGSVSGAPRAGRTDVPSEIWGLLRACVQVKAGTRYLTHEDLTRIVGAPASKLRREVIRRLRLERKWCNYPIAAHVFIVPASELI